MPVLPPGRQFNPMLTAPLIYPPVSLPGSVSNISVASNTDADFTINKRFKRILPKSNTVISTPLSQSAEIKLEDGSLLKLRREFKRFAKD